MKRNVLFCSSTSMESRDGFMGSSARSLAERFMGRNWFLGLVIIGYLCPSVGFGQDSPAIGSYGERIFGNGAISGYSLSPDGKILITRNSVGLFLWEFTAEGYVLERFEQDLPAGGYYFISNTEVAIVGDVVYHWDFETLTEQNAIPKRYNTRAISSNHRYLVEIGGLNDASEFPVVVKDLVTGTVVREVTLQGTDNISATDCTQLSSDGRYLVRTYGTTMDASPKEIRLWDLQNPPNFTVLFNSESEVFLYGDVADFSPDSRYLVAGSEQGNVYLWNLESSALVWSKTEGNGTVFATKFTPDGKRILIDSMSTIWSDSSQMPDPVDNWLGLALLDASTGNLALDFEDLDQKSSGANYQFTEDGKRLCAHPGSDINFWDGETGQILSQFQLSSVEYFDLSVSQNSPVMAVKENISNTTSIRLFDYEKEQEIQRIDTGLSIQSIGISPDGKTLITSGWIVVDGFTTPQLWLWDIASAQVLTTIDVENTISKIVMSPDGQELFLIDSYKPKRIDVSTGETLHRYEGHFANSTLDIEYSPSGKYIAILNGEWLEIHDASSDQLILEKQFESQTGSMLDVNFSNDESYVYVSSATHLYRISLPGGEMVDILTSKRPDFILFSIDEDHHRLIGSGKMSFPAWLSLWNVSSGEMMLRAPWHGLGAVFSPDGSKIMTIYEDYTLRIYDADRLLPQASVGNRYFYR